ncbi:hypothetical protein EX30DRAFT_398674 [Ascodesmis nigricans]|uniref:Uncharacterized protein n=1 Tax=Ascodesmis nigricans TaxID=341454 RepID=A0A4S2MPN5_9PEZI|nr:hypothetical protein EX30DRAFT_398674 [Ascodesmis nigricans]
MSGTTSEQKPAFSSQYSEAALASQAIIESAQNREHTKKKKAQLPGATAASSSPQPGRLQRRSSYNYEMACSGSRPTTSDSDGVPAAVANPPSPTFTRRMSFDRNEHKHLLQHKCVVKPNETSPAGFSEVQPTESGST